MDHSYVEDLLYYDASLLEREGGPSLKGLVFYEKLLDFYGYVSELLLLVNHGLKTLPSDIEAS